MIALWPSVRKEVPSLIFERSWSWNTVSYLPEYISYLRILKHKALAFSDCAKIWISNFSSFPEDFQLRSTSEIFFFLNPQERPGWINASFQVLENLGSLSLSSIEFVPQSTNWWEWCRTFWPPWALHYFCIACLLRAVAVSVPLLSLYICVFFLSGTDTPHWHLLSTYIVCHTLRWVYLTCVLSFDLDNRPARWISCLPFTDKFGFQNYLPKVMGLRCGEAGVKTETFARHNGGWAHRALIWIANLSWREAVVSFCGASLFQLAVVFPLKLWQAMNSRENVTKQGVVQMDSVCESFLLEEPQARHKGQ